MKNQKIKLIQCALDYTQKVIDTNLSGTCKRKGLIQLQALYATLRELQDLIVSETDAGL